MRHGDLSRRTQLVMQCRSAHHVASFACHDCGAIDLATLWLDQDLDKACREQASQPNRLPGIAVFGWTFHVQVSWQQGLGRYWMSGQVPGMLRSKVGVGENSQWACPLSLHPASSGPLQPARACTPHTQSSHLSAPAHSCPQSPPAAQLSSSARLRLAGNAGMVNQQPPVDA